MGRGCYYVDSYWPNPLTVIDLVCPIPLKRCQPVHKEATADSAHIRLAGIESVEKSV